MSVPECGLIFPDPDPTTRGIIISCYLPEGHAGAHRGFDISKRYGAIWNPERLLKLLPGGGESNDITKEPA